MQTFLGAFSYFMIMPNPMKGKLERKYLEKMRNYPDAVYNAHQDSPQEGFEFFFEGSAMDGDEEPSLLDSIKVMRGSGSSLKGVFNKLRTILRFKKDMFNGRDACFSDLEPYIKEIEEKNRIENSEEKLQSYPNIELWNELNHYISNKWNDVLIGFTELPSQFIFKNKMVLFKYALVVVQEMKKDMIDDAPGVLAGRETMRVYASLGLVVNDLARWLREKGVKSQSNHPLGGLVNDPPLAGKAGLGWQGKQGVLITREYGPRVRIAPIFIQNKIFEYTDSVEHKWIEKYCKTCGLCEINCPVQAIYPQRKISISNIPGFGDTRTCIDRAKCLPYFNETVGCSVCLKVCPFSNGQKTYDKLKKLIN